MYYLNFYKVDETGGKKYHHIYRVFVGYLPTMKEYQIAAIMKINEHNWQIQHTKAAQNFLKVPAHVTTKSYTEAKMKLKQVITAAGLKGLWDFHTGHNI